MSQFAFLQREWSGVFDAAARAEAAVVADPHAAFSCAWRAPEMAEGRADGVGGVHEENPR